MSRVRDRLLAEFSQQKMGVQVVCTLGFAWSKFKGRLNEIKTFLFCEKSIYGSRKFTGGLFDLNRMKQAVNSVL